MALWHMILIWFINLVTDSPHLPHVNAGRTCKSAIHGVHHHQVASAHGCKVLQASTVFERDLRAINLQIPIFCHIARPMRAIIDFFSNLKCLLWLLILISSRSCNLIHAHRKPTVNSDKYYHIRQAWHSPFGSVTPATENFVPVDAGPWSVLQP